MILSLLSSTVGAAASKLIKFPDEATPYSITVASQDGGEIGVAVGKGVGEG